VPLGVLLRAVQSSQIGEFSGPRLTQGRPAVRTAHTDLPIWPREFNSRHPLTREKPLATGILRLAASSYGGRIRATYPPCALTTPAVELLGSECAIRCAGGPGRGLYKLLSHDRDHRFVASDRAVRCLLIPAARFAASDDIAEALVQRARP
jgi:hypothetical protein